MHDLYQSWPDKNRHILPIETKAMVLPTLLLQLSLAIFLAE